jgi:hypothetical protein
VVEQLTTPDLGVGEVLWTKMCEFSDVCDLSFRLSIPGGLAPRPCNKWIDWILTGKEAIIVCVKMRVEPKFVPFCFALPRSLATMRPRLIWPGKCKVGIV